MVVWPDDKTPHAEVFEHTVESGLGFVPSTESAISDWGKSFLAYTLKYFRLSLLTTLSTVVTSVAKNKFCAFDGIEGLA
jgi:hypothetical protein